MAANEELKYSSELISDAVHASTVLSVMFAAIIVMVSMNLVLSANDSKVVTSSIKEEQVKDFFGSPILCNTWVAMLKSIMIFIFIVTFSIELTIDDKVDIDLCKLSADIAVVGEVVVAVFDDVGAVVDLFVVFAKIYKYNQYDSGQSGTQITNHRKVGCDMDKSQFLFGQPSHI